MSIFRSTLQIHEISSDGALSLGDFTKPGKPFAVARVDPSFCEFPLQDTLWEGSIDKLGGTTLIARTSPFRPSSIHVEVVALCQHRHVADYIVQQSPGWQSYWRGYR